MYEIPIGVLVSIFLALATIFYKLRGECLKLADIAEEITNEKIVLIEKEYLKTAYLCYGDALARWYKQKREEGLDDKTIEEKFMKFKGLPSSMLDMEHPVDPELFSKFIGLGEAFHSLLESNSCIEDLTDIFVGGIISSFITALLIVSIYFLYMFMPDSIELLIGLAVLSLYFSIKVITSIPKIRIVERYRKGLKVLKHINKIEDIGEVIGEYFL